MTEKRPQEDLFNSSFLYYFAQCMMCEKHSDTHAAGQK